MILVPEIFKSDFSNYDTIFVSNKDLVSDTSEFKSRDIIFTEFKIGKRINLIEIGKMNNLYGFKIENENQVFCIPTYLDPLKIKKQIETKFGYTVQIYDGS